MVAEEDGWAGSLEDAVWVLDDEFDARGEAGQVVECAGSGPLGNVLVADEGEGYGGDDAVDGAGEKGDVDGERAGDEAS